MLLAHVRKVGFFFKINVRLGISQLKLINVYASQINATFNSRKERVMMLNQSLWEIGTKLYGNSYAWREI